MINKYLRIKKLFIKVLLLLPLICIGFGGSKGISTDEEKRLYGDTLKDLIKKSTYAGVLYENHRNSAVREAQVRGHWSTVA